jgi:hypothetical protein
MFNIKNFEHKNGANRKTVPGPNFRKKHNKITPFPLKIKRGYQITSFLGHMYEYFTFVHYLSFIEDRVKSTN